MRKKSHYNYCIECNAGFSLLNNPDYCEKCRIILGISLNEYEEEFSDVEISNRRFQQDDFEIKEISV